MRIRIKIQGATPLLMHKFNPEDLKGGSSLDKNSLPRDVAEHHAYRDPKTKELYIEGKAIFACIMEAGKFHKKGIRQLTTGKTSLIPAFVSLEEFNCSLGTKKFEVDTQFVNNQLKGKVELSRPRLDKWSVQFTLEIDEKELSEKEIRAVIDSAGKKCGLLSFTPRHKGQYGKFVISEWKVLKN